VLQPPFCCGFFFDAVMTTMKTTTIIIMQRGEPEPLEEPPLELLEPLEE
jgi:hypothetical protein